MLGCKLGLSMRRKSVQHKEALSLALRLVVSVLMIALIQIRSSTLARTFAIAFGCDSGQNSRKISVQVLQMHLCTVPRLVTFATFQVNRPLVFLMQ